MPSATTTVGMFALLTITIYILMFVIPDSLLLVDEESPIIVPEDYMTGEILTLSEIQQDVAVLSLHHTNSGDQVSIDDLTEYKFYDVSQGEWEILNNAKENEIEVIIQYQKIDGSYYLDNVGVGIEIPQPPEEPYEFPWWIIAFPLGICICFFIIPKVGFALWRRHQRAVVDQELKEAKRKKQIETKRKKQKEKQKQQIKKYQKEGRSSRMSKAAQILDEKEKTQKRK